MPITDSTSETLDAPGVRFFDRPFAPGDDDPLAGAVAGWLRSEPLRWLVDNVPGRREPGGPAVPLRWPRALADPGGPAGDGRVRLANAVDALGEICDWSLPGTVWDQRANGERPLEGHGPPPPRAVAAGAVAARAAALGLCSHGRLRTQPRTLVVLGGRRLAPLNRARAAARAIRAAPPAPVRVVLLSGRRTLDRDERESARVAAYATGARTEADLMLAAAERVFGPDPAVEIRLVEVPAPPGARRASTYDTLELIADELATDPAAPVGLVTSPTCRPFQYLDAARALGLGGGLSFELVAHPRAWAAAPGAPDAAPHVYLQEVRSAIQAAGRLAAALTDRPASLPEARPAALARAT